MNVPTPLVRRAVAHVLTMTPDELTAFLSGHLDPIELDRLVDLAESVMDELDERKAKALL